MPLLITKIMRKKAFTLIEILTTIVVLATMIAIAVVTMPGAMRRSYTIEARSGLTSIYTQMRLLRIRSGSFNEHVAGNRAVVGNVPGFRAGDLRSTYFVDADYTITGIALNTFTARVRGSRAPVAGVEMTINENGTVTGP